MLSLRKKGDIILGTSYYEDNPFKIYVKINYQKKGYNFTAYFGSNRINDNYMFFLAKIKHNDINTSVVTGSSLTDTNTTTMQVLNSLIKSDLGDNFGLLKIIDGVFDYYFIATMLTFYDEAVKEIKLS